MSGTKHTIKTLSAQLRDPKDIEVLRALLKRQGKRLQLARLSVKEGYLFYAGTAGGCTSYWMHGVCYGRSKSSVDRKAVLKKKCFEGSRRSAARFGQANALASSLYAEVFEYRRTYPLFCFLKKRAIALLKEGKTNVEAEEVLREYLEWLGMTRKQKQKQKEKEKGKQKQKEKETSTVRPSVSFEFNRNIQVDLVWTTPSIIAGPILCQVDST